MRGGQDLRAQMRRRQVAGVGAVVQRCAQIDVARLIAVVAFVPVVSGAHCMVLIDGSSAPGRQRSAGSAR
jgi:hypothetical protein